MTDLADPATVLRSRGVRVTAPRVAVVGIARRASAARDASTRSSRPRAGGSGRSRPRRSTTSCEALHEAGLVRRIEPAGQPGAATRRASATTTTTSSAATAGARSTSTARSARRRASLRAQAAGFEVDEAEVIFWGRCPTAPRPEGGADARATDRRNETRRARMSEATARRGPDDPPGPSGLRQPEPAHRRRPRARRRSRTTTSSRRSATSTASGSRSASSTPAASSRYGYFEAYGTVGDEPISTYTRAKLFQETGKRTAGRDPLLDGDRRPRLVRGGARPARLRGQVLHRGRQLGPGRQQPRRSSSSATRSSSRTSSTRSSRTRSRSRQEPNRDLRLHEPDARVDAHAHAGSSARAASRRATGTCRASASTPTSGSTRPARPCWSSTTGIPKQGVAVADRGRRRRDPGRRSSAPHRRTSTTRSTRGDYPRVGAATSRS